MKNTWPSEISPSANTRLTVGRSSKCDVTIKHVAVSGTHFALEFNEGHLVVEDLDSRYGTFVNGGRVKKISLESGIPDSKHTVLQKALVKH